MTNDCGPQAPAGQPSTTVRAPNHNGTSSRLITDTPSKQNDLGMRTKELDTVYQVLKGFLSRKQRHQSWKKWSPVLERYPLSSHTPFLNIVSFVNEIARENGFDRQQTLKFRAVLLRSLVKNNAYGNKNPLPMSNSLPMNITLKNRAQRIRYNISGMTKYESATIGIDAKSNLVLMTKRGMVMGTRIRILLQKGQGDQNSALRISGRVAHIDSSKLGSPFKYIIQVKKTDYALAA